MKTKRIPVLLLIFIFGGLFLLGHTSAWADWSRHCLDSQGNDLTDSGECLILGSDSQPLMWTLKAFIGCQDASHNPVACSTKQDNSEIPVDIDVNWPICDSTNNRVIFRYILGPYALSNTKSAVSYLVYDWPVLPLVGGTPSGAALDISQFASLFAACEPVLSGSGDLAYKLNPSVNNKTDAIIDIYMPAGTRVNTGGQAWLKWSSYCDSGTIWTAGPTIPFAPTRPFPDCGNNNSVTVNFNACGQVQSVICANGTAHLAPHPAICTDSNRTVCSDDVNLGPRGVGAVICTDTPVFVYGQRFWFCPPYPGSQ
jgi:hypothetical protein